MPDNFPFFKASNWNTNSWKIRVMPCQNDIHILSQMLCKLALYVLDDASQSWQSNGEM